MNLRTLVLGLTMSVAGVSAAAAGVVEITVRDAVSGARVAARVEAAGPVPSAIRALGPGRVDVDAGGEPIGLVIAARGYAVMTTRFDRIAAPHLPVTVWLDRHPGTPDLDDRDREALERGESVIRGHVYDAASGEPVAGAVVSLGLTGWGSISDGDGAFRFELDAPPVEVGGPDELGDLDELLVDAAGYVSEVRQQFLVAPGVTSLIVDLERGEGTEVRPPTHKMLNLDAPAQVGGAAVESGPPSKVIQPIDPPPSIKVGTDCVCSSCQEVSIMSLETYVQRGLNDEWIASWAADSLLAGAVAYRSYGSWYVAHPINGSYDICSTTCCQVNDSDTHSATTAAAMATAGFLLERGGSVFRSEYSAENNAWDPDGAGCSNEDLSCENGEAGSPEFSWSCLADSPCFNQECYGHGRGMCQWGTSRRATSGQSWPAIVNHYYNGSGTGTGLRTARLTTPVWIDGLAPTPQVVLPGGSFSIAVAATNGGELAHSAIMIGASLHSAATGYIDDPDHDQPVTLDPGSQQVARTFTVPGGTPEGAYDLLVSLYYDVNGDGDITSGDLGLVLVTEVGAITVSLDLFSDGFESGTMAAWSSAGP